MSISDNGTMPTTADPTYVAIIAALIRGLLQVASGIGLGWGAFVSGDQITMLAWAVVMVGTLCWSAYQKIQAVRRKQHAAIASAQQSAEASASQGTPIAIVVTDPKRTSA